MLTQPLIEKLVADSATKIEFDIRCCLRSRFNKNKCTRCLEVCQSAALELQGRQVIFDAEKCTSCMLCTAVCPNDAFAHPIGFLSLIQLLAEKETAQISCEKKTGNHDHITVPCIGFLSEPMLAAMNSVARGNCFIDVRRCAECANVHSLKTLHENMENVITKMRGKGKTRLRYLLDQQPGGFPYSKKTKRRLFLRSVRKTIADMGKDAVSSQPARSEKTKDPHSKGRVKNSAGLQFALSIAPDERVYEKDLLLSYFFSVSTNEQCDCCPSCMGMCPTGALKRKKESDKKHLTFISSRCSGCGLCVQFCKKSALTLKNGFSGDPNFTLQIANI